MKSNMVQKKRLPGRLIPIMIFLSVIPLIVRFHAYESHLTKYAWFSQEGMATDFFLYWKSIAIIAISMIMAILLLVQIFYYNKKQEFKQIYQQNRKLVIVLGIYFCFSILSTFFSISKEDSLNGGYNQFESIWVLLGYGIVLLYGIFMLKEEKDLHIIFNVWMVSLVFLIIIGILQFMGYSVFLEGIGKYFTIPLQYISALSGQEIQHEESSMVLLTLYNSNYTGVYMSMAVPTIGVIAFTEKDMRKRIFYIILEIGLLFCTWFSLSRSVFLAISFSLLIGSIVYFSKIKQQLKYVFILLIMLIFLSAAINFLTGGTYFKRFQSFTDTTISNQLDFIKTTHDGIHMSIDGKGILISYEVDQDGLYSISCVDDNEQKVSFSLDTEHTLKTNDERFKLIALTPVVLNKIPSLQIKIMEESGDKDWYFSNQLEQQGYFYYNAVGKWDMIQDVKKFSFLPDGFMSHRGYIWSRTIPLLKNFMFIGSGPDTFLLDFPQNDYIGRYKNGYETTLISKPHNLYLQIWIQTGFISLVAFLGIFIMYFIKGIKIYRNIEEFGWIARLGIGIWLGLVAYIIMGLANDSNVCTAPVFWTLLSIEVFIQQKIE